MYTKDVLRTLHSEQTPIEVVQTISTWKLNAKERKALVMNKHFPEEELWNFIDDESVPVQIAVAVRATNPELLTKMVEAEDERVQVAVARNPHTPAEVLASMFRNNVDIQRSLAANPTTPKEVIRKIFMNPADPVCSKYIVRYFVRELEEICPVSEVKDLCAASQEAIATLCQNPAYTDELVKVNPTFETAKQLAGNPFVSPETLHWLIDWDDDALFDLLTTRPKHSRPHYLNSTHVSKLIKLGRTQILDYIVLMNAIMDMENLPEELYNHLSSTGKSSLMFSPKWVEANKRVLFYECFSSNFYVAGRAKNAWTAYYEGSVTDPKIMVEQMQPDFPEIDLTVLPVDWLIAAAENKYSTVEG